MLKRLQIQNYAIIDFIKIDFSSSLNIITGETGAGKSILIGALSLILGERADTSVLLHKEKKCYVEGNFKTAHPFVKNFLEQNELDQEDEIMIRREISTSGKSRAFINDTPVNLAQLKQLSSLLVDLHQQFDTLELGDGDFQREVIDALAGNGKDLSQYQAEYKNYRKVLHELDYLRQEQSAANKEFDYNKFLFDELDEANFKENEIENIEKEIKLLSNAENIKLALSEINFQMQESDVPLVQQLKSLTNKLQALSSFHPSIETLSERLSAVHIELRDIASEIELINNSVTYDPQKLEKLNDRMTEGYRLLKKHNVRSTSDLLELKNNLTSKLEKITNLSETIDSKEKLAKEYQKAATNFAEKISGKRRNEILPFEKKVNALLAQVGMPNGRLKVEIKKDKTLNQFGSDTIEFLFNANMPASTVNSLAEFQPLKKVASGGELSRLMLSIKSLVAKKIQLPTLIFDEIDTGISGEAARQVGMIMKDLAEHHQVISITHQPQIASKADTHFFVYKETKNGQVITSIKELNADERITTIAMMLSGEKPTAAAFENAREMIER
ncbi:MAG: DNA repair protein RecN [Ginsengibacter sp.]